MWRSHMVVGASSGWFGLHALAGVTGTPLDTRDRAFGAVIAAGGALVCDMDTRNSRLAHSLGPVTQLAATVIGRVFGGHRHGTHSLAFCAASAAIGATALAQPELVHIAGVTLTVGELVALAIGYFATALAVSLVLSLRGAGAAVTAAVLVAIAAATPPAAELVTAAFTIGVCSHLLGDALTPEGVMLAWPLSTQRSSLPLIKRTGDTRETLVVLAIAAATIAIAGGFA
jgi:membrane-bound metal-dependent hydrolase YbcI (DUF457 family)